MAHSKPLHAKFSSIGELDNATLLHLRKRSSNKTDKAVDHLIREFSTEHFSTHNKHETIQHSLDKSNSILRHTIHRLVELDIMNRIHYAQSVMRSLEPDIYATLPAVWSDQETGAMSERFK